MSMLRYHGINYISVTLALDGEEPGNGYWLIIYEVRIPRSFCSNIGH